MAKGFDASQMMQQARKMKSEMDKVQQRLKERVIEESAGDGLVRVFVNGGAELVGVKIAKSVVDPDDIGMLEDLIQVAVNKGLERANEMSNAEMNKVTGGMGGMF